MSDKIKLQDYLLSCDSIIQSTLIGYQKEKEVKLTPQEQGVFMEKFIKFIKSENAQGNIYQPDFDVVRVIRSAINETMALPRFRKPEVIHASE